LLRSKFLLAASAAALAAMLNGFNCSILLGIVKKYCGN
jgi:hypothetical protein